MADSEVWIPPVNPDAQEILNEALDDSIARRYAVSLAKHVWFHEHALSYCPALSGVRLSFALSYWYQLAMAYPPAMHALKRARDRAETQFHKSGFAFSYFHDLVALNRLFGKQERSVEAFKIADGASPVAASRIYHVAESSLIREKEYRLCGKYLKPKEQLGLEIECFTMRRKYEMERSETEPRPPDTAVRFFSQKVTTLVALLVKNGRREEAEWVCQEASARLDDDLFKSGLASALLGNLPESWP